MDTSTEMPLLFLTFVPFLHSSSSFQLESRAGYDNSSATSLCLLFYAKSYHRLWNMSSFYDHLLKLIQKSDNSSSELPQGLKHFLMTFFYCSIMELYCFNLSCLMSTSINCLLDHDPMSKEFSHFVRR